MLPASMLRGGEGRRGHVGVLREQTMICLLILKRHLLINHFFKCVEEHDNFHKFHAFSTERDAARKERKMRNDQILSFIYFQFS